MFKARLGAKQKKFLTTPIPQLNGTRSRSFSTFSIQIWDLPYATAGHGGLVDRFVTCNVKIYGASGSLFPYKFGRMYSLESIMLG